MSNSSIEPLLDEILDIMKNRNIRTYRSDLELLKEQVSENQIDEAHRDRVRSICEQPKAIRDIHIPGMACGEWDMKIFRLLDAIES